MLTNKAEQLLLTPPNEIFWVDSNTGHDDNKGTFESPFATLLAASTLANHDVGDVIVLKAGHTENVDSSNQAAITKRGLHVIGLGQGNARPSFIIGQNSCFQVGDNDSSDYTVENLYIENINWSPGHTNIGNFLNQGALDVDAGNSTFVNCSTTNFNTSYRFDHAISIDPNRDGTYVKFINHVHIDRGTTAGVSVFSGDSGGGSVGTNCEINVKYAYGNWSQGFYYIPSSSILIPNNLQILGSASSPAYIRNLNSSDKIINVHANTTGRVGPYINIRLQDNAANITEALSVGKMEIMQPVNLVNADGESSMQANNTASTDA